MSTEQVPSGKRRGWNAPTVVGAVALLVGVGIGSASGNSSQKASAATSAQATVTVTATPSSKEASPQKATTVTATATVTATVTASPPAPAPAAKVLDVTGSGIKNTKDFTVTSNEWTVSYAYDCTAELGSQGNFMLEADKPDESGLGDMLANELAAKGASSTVGHGKGTYYLSINSECNWHVTVNNGA